MSLLELADVLRSIAAGDVQWPALSREALGEAANELERFAALPERLQLMSAAEREAGRAAVHRAVAYETAAEMVAGGRAI